MKQRVRRVEFGCMHGCLVDREHGWRMWEALLTITCLQWTGLGIYLLTVVVHPCFIYDSLWDLTWSIWLWVAVTKYVISAHDSINWYVFVLKNALWWFKGAQAVSAWSDKSDDDGCGRVCGCVRLFPFCDRPRCAASGKVNACMCLARCVYCAQN